MSPVLAPKHNTFTTVEVALNAAAGCVKVFEWVSVQPLASVMVTVYVPGGLPEISCVVAPVDHK